MTGTNISFLPALRNALIFAWMAFVANVTFAQSFPQVDTTGGWLIQAPTTILLPNSPLKVQMLFIGGYDSVLTNKGMARAKERNDYTTFVPITPGVSDSGYVCISHETIDRDSMIGDGGGMSILKVVRSGDSLRVVGPARAVDFRPVGGTLGNCAGITGPDGQVWSGEESLRTSNLSLNSADTFDLTLAPMGQAPGKGEVFNDIPGIFSGKKIKAWQNYNYMVKIDPVNAVAVRKQYNWGRMQHEGGAVLPDNRTVIVTPDDGPAYLIKFVADQPGDFSTGKTYAYKTDSVGNGSWQEIYNRSLDSTMMLRSLAARDGCTQFFRLEWAGEHNGKVYFSETGRDLPQANFRGEHLKGARIANHHLDRARLEYPDWAALSNDQVTDSICFSSRQYHDFYGRVLVFDPVTDEVNVYLEGGPKMVSGAPYPEIHLSNPDGLAFLHVDGRDFMLIAEDLIGTSAWRIHPDANAAYCEVFALDMSIANPQISDLMRIAVMPIGAEATGTASTPDGKTVFFTSQHPLFSNPFPHNHSITYAISGWDVLLEKELKALEEEPLKVWPNPADQMLNFSKQVTLEVYNVDGKRMLSLVKARRMDCSSLLDGLYVLRFSDGSSAKVIVRHE